VLHLITPKNLRKMKKLSFLLSFSLVAIAAQAQQQTLEAPGRPGMYPEVLTFQQGQEPQFVPGTVLLKSTEGFRTSNEVLKLRSEKDAKGVEHIRFQQTIHAIPVEGAVYVAHVASGKLKGQNGQWFENLPQNLSSKAAISPEAALQSAMQAFGAKTYKWQLPEEEAFIKNESGNPAATFYPKATLVYYSGEQELSSDQLRLAYKLDLYAQDPMDRRIYFVDAENGKILGTRELIHHTNATGTAVTGYVGTQTITTDYTGATYRLRETGRGNGVQTYNLQKGTNYNNAVDFTDADNYWNNVNSNKDQYATDAHFGAEMTYDYYYGTYGRNSIDGSGFAIKSYVHYSTNYFNAFWDGTRMTYGDGSSTDNYKPLTSLDVCGHEITHGLTDFTAGLNYSYESGAMNEGFSDIFGTMIEFYASNGNGNWLIGDAFYTIRSMSNPNAYGQPDTYKGNYWATGSSDNGGVHTNSGVLNYWFYLLSQGGSGTNDKGFAFSVSGLGNTKAAAIAYSTLVNYLTPTSQYAQARTASIQAATALYGATSNEVTQVANAWDAVNVGNSTPPPTCTDNYESNESRNASKSIATNTDIIAKIGSSNDKDWFTFTTTSSAPKLKVTLQNLPYDYDVRLYNSNGSQIGISQNGGTTSESITYNSSSSAATYYVQVYGYAGAYSSTNCYTLRIATSNVNLLADEEGQGILAGTGKTSTMPEAAVIFPNPADQSATLRYQSEDEGNLELILTDLTGRVVSKNNVNLQKGINHIELNLSSLTPGMYYLQLPDGNTMKLSVQH
jgi:Zn-dependent metalloprotease